VWQRLRLPPRERRHRSPVRDSAAGKSRCELRRGQSYQSEFFVSQVFMASSVDGGGVVAATDSRQTEAPAGFATQFTV
jgi:hypothetical protein